MRRQRVCCLSKAHAGRCLFVLQSAELTKALSWYCNAVKGRDVKHPDSKRTQRAKFESIARKAGAQ